MSYFSVRYTDQNGQGTKRTTLIEAPTLEDALALAPKYLAGLRGGPGMSSSSYVGTPVIDQVVQT